jgi:hypothetical protein
MSARKAYVPRNSLGQPWREGQSWSCSACGLTGPDRDDVNMPDCTVHGSRGAHGLPLTFHPKEHAAAIAARKEAR